MPETYWYAYANDGRSGGPYFETRDECAEACADGETPRPVSGDVIDIDDDASDGLDDLTHTELKAEAERQGIADDIDLRSKASIRDALRDT